MNLVRLLLLLLIPLNVWSRDLPDSLGLGVGASFLDARKPISRADYYFHFSFGMGLSSNLELVTSFEFGLPEAGALDNKNKRLFLGNITEEARLSIGFFEDQARVGAFFGGGGFMTRHSQTRITANGGGGTGARFGPLVISGVFYNWYPLLHQVYQWNDLFIQTKIVYYHYFGSRVIDRSGGVLVAFGGSF